ncbi:MAG: hypothetical protein IPK82_03520 [Polyangiaceae bacterium]|nr:hypothetical protein [Polyangiaceae bacterium]
MRSTLSLYAMDRPALQAFSKDLRALLMADNRAELANLLELRGALAERLNEAERAIDWFLKPDTNTEAAPLFSSLRRIAKKRALTLSWTSPEASLEGRLRQYDLLREDPQIASRIDKLLNPSRLPWFLVLPGAACGWIDSVGRIELAGLLRPIRASLPPELVAFAEALAEVDGDVIAHDSL